MQINHGSTNTETSPTDRLPDHFHRLWNMKVAEQIRAGVDVVRLDVGSPDLPPPDEVIAQLRQSSLDPDKHGYQPILGPDALREAWVGMYARTFGVSLDPATDVLPLLGSKEGIFLLTMALVDPGDIVLVPALAYPTYEAAARFAGAQIFRVPLKISNDSYLELDEIPPDIAQRSRLLWINFPHNPTGATTTFRGLRQCLEFCCQHRILLCHDAAYAQVTYGEYPAPSMLQLAGSRESAVEFNSLSKSFNMAGWRAGVLLGQHRALSAVAKLIPNLNSGSFGPINDASIAALQMNEEWILNRNEVYRERRDFLLRTLNGFGCEARTPEAGLYVWARTPEGWGSLPFTSEILSGAGVSLVPGTVFGPGGEGWFRISLTAPPERLEIGVERLKSWWLRNLQ
ncbi:MAG: aminotransferase class I/II-fold pyridoxal phosphate-dependent enzyme [Anaerolineales bacterium]|nr:aminotransferase class I/II-fold pyridoxal phosphate-dependent enzyme [Anaerolineales bacterium]